MLCIYVCIVLRPIVENTLSFWYLNLLLRFSQTIRKFKSQLTSAFFAAVNHLNGPLRKQTFTLTGSKGQGL